MYKYSMTQWIVGNEDMEYSFQRLQKYGYDGIEFAAEPATLDARHLRALMARYGIRTATSPRPGARRPTRPCTT